MYSNNLEGRQGSDLIQYSTPWEYELTNKQTSCPGDNTHSLNSAEENQREGWRYLYRDQEGVRKNTLWK